MTTNQSLDALSSMIAAALDALPHDNIIAALDYLIDDPAADPASYLLPIPAFRALNSLRDDMTDDEFYELNDLRFPFLINDEIINALIVDAINEIIENANECLSFLQ